MAILENLFTKGTFLQKFVLGKFSNNLYGINLQDKSYAEQLQTLNLPSLKCLMFKLINNYFTTYFHIYSVFSGTNNQMSPI